jgi:hypothetical protein
LGAETSKNNGKSFLPDIIFASAQNLAEKNRTKALSADCGFSKPKEPS